jgi:N-acetylmuramoyl-L-alanine amidase
LNITKKLIKFNYTPYENNPMYIVVHDTGNRKVGANAQMHFDYFNSADRQASAHFFVDDLQILQVVEIEDESWHCGDGANKYGINNGNSIGVEICVNSDGNYAKAVDNAKNVVMHLMKTYCIPIDDVVRHYDASGKNCPQSMNNNGDWSAWTCFKNTLKGRSVIVDKITDIDEALKYLYDNKVITNIEFRKKVCDVVQYEKEFVLNIANSFKSLPK